MKITTGEAPTRLGLSLGCERANVLYTRRRPLISVVELDRGHVLSNRLGIMDVGVLTGYAFEV